MPRHPLTLSDAALIVAVKRLHCNSSNALLRCKHCSVDSRYNTRFVCQAGQSCRVPKVGNSLQVGPFCWDLGPFLWHPFPLPCSGAAVSVCCAWLHLLIFSPRDK